MPRLRVLLAVILGLATPLGALADRPPSSWTPPRPPTAQQVLVVVSPQFHAEELNAVVAGFADRGAAVTVSTPADMAALSQGLRPELLHPMPGPGGEELRKPVEVIGFTDAIADQRFNKVVLVGGGWHPEFYTYDPAAKRYELSPPHYADDLFRLIRTCLDSGGVLGAYGAGLYPVVLSGSLPRGTPLATYSCGDLLTAAGKGQYKTIVPLGPPKKGWAPAQVYYAHGSWGLVTVSVPNAWYGPDEGALLMEHYGAAIEAFVAALEDAFYGALSPGVVATIEPVLPRKEIAYPKARHPQVEEFVVTGALDAKNQPADRSGVFTSQHAQLVVWLKLRDVCASLRIEVKVYAPLGRLWERMAGATTDPKEKGVNCFRTYTGSFTRSFDPATRPVGTWWVEGFVDGVHAFTKTFEVTK